MTNSLSRLQFLDGLRGIAALMVTIAHCYRLLEGHGLLKNQLNPLVDIILKNGHIGVEIFFVLSGFVITYSIRNQIMNFKFLCNFILRRSIRLDPPYWTILALLLLLTFVGKIIFPKHDEMMLSSVLINMFYLQDILGINAILPVAWTLCIELQFYLVFISLLALIESIHQKYWPSNAFSVYQSSAFLMIFGFLGLISIGQHSGLLEPLPGLFIPYWYSFFIGCLTCLTLNRLQSPYVFGVYYSLIAGSLFIYFNLNTIMILMTSLIIYLAGKYGKFNQWLVSPLFQYTGKISYSLYLIHWPIGMKLIDVSLRLFKTEWSFPLALLLFISSLSLSLLAAHTFYQWIEYPFLKWSQSFKENINLKRSSPLFNERGSFI